jgi:sugar-specific transcriptional regulator TrmB
MELNNFLGKFGLEEKETEIYLTLLSKGNLTASELSRILKIPRSTIQFKCQGLTDKGLVKSLASQNSHTYFAEPPEKIGYLLERKIVEIDAMKGQLPELILALKKNAGELPLIPKIKYFEGVEGIVEMFEDVLKDGNILYGMTKNEGKMNQEVLNYLDKKYIPRRKSLRFPAWIIFNDNPTTRSYLKNDQALNRVSLLVPDEKYPFTACCHIYGNKVAFYSYANDDLSGVIIDNPIIKKTQLSLFHLAWNYVRLLPVNKLYAKVELEGF